jgi:Mce-associated membrane protein
MPRQSTPASPAAEAPATEATEPEATESEAQAAEGPDAANPAPDADAPAAVALADEELVPEEPVHQELVPGHLVDRQLVPSEPGDRELVPEELGTGKVVASDSAVETHDAESPGTGADGTGADDTDTDDTDTDDSRTDDTDTDGTGTDGTDGTDTDGTDTDDSRTDDSGADGTRAGAPSAARPARRRGLVPVLLIAGACVLGGLASVAAIQAHSLRSDQASGNMALTDAATTSQVRRQVTSAINTIFSYNYADTATTRAAAQRLLTGPAVREYDSLFRLVQQDAPAQHLVLTTKVTDAGVELLVGGRARVLIFADQRDTRKTTSQTSYAGAMFAVNAVLRDGRWKIENIDTFTGGS